MDITLTTTKNQDKQLQDALNAVNVGKSAKDAMTAQMLVSSLIDKYLAPSAAAPVVISVEGRQKHVSPSGPPPVPAVLPAVLPDGQAAKGAGVQSDQP